MFSSRCVSVCEPFMVTDSIHLSRPFTVKRQMPVKSPLDSFSSSPTTAAVDSSAQESPPWVHTLLNQPTAHQNSLWVSENVLQDLKVWRTKHLFWQWGTILSEKPAISLASWRGAATEKSQLQPLIVIFCKKEILVKASTPMGSASKCSLL